MIAEKMLTMTEAAEFLGLTRQAFAEFRCGRGPDEVKVLGELNGRQSMELAPVPFDSPLSHPFPPVAAAAGFRSSLNRMRFPKGSITSTHLEL
jgi:hypothetical protein